MSLHVNRLIALSSVCDLGRCCGRCPYSRWAIFGRQKAGADAGGGATGAGGEEAAVFTRAVESKSLKVGKSLKIGKNRIKSEKSEFIFY